MIRTKITAKINVIISIFAWLALVFTNFSVIFSKSKDIESYGFEIPRLCFLIFVLSVFFYFKIKISKFRRIDFVELLWRVFVTGLVLTIISVFFQIILTLFGSTKLATNILVLIFIYLINIGLVVVFLISTFLVWKKLILYQKSIWLMKSWKFFEYGILIALFFDLFYQGRFVFFKIGFTIILVLLAMFLSANTKWVAFLNFKQKWKSILLNLLVLVYLGYFCFSLLELTAFISEFNISFDTANSIIFQDVRSSIFIISLFVFAIAYALFSLLVILFNIPTSSVFEQKFEEILNFQRLGQSIQTENSEERVFEILLESSVSTTLADAAWIELINHKHDKNLFLHNIDKGLVQKIKDYFEKRNTDGIVEYAIDKTKNPNRYISKIKEVGYHSMLVFPILIKDNLEGTLVLLRSVRDGFNHENNEIIKAFANQASISIENFRLLYEAIQNERYKEVLKIAKNVQQRLLPQQLETHEQFEVTAFSVSADEVGGDYYDMHKIDKERFSIVISDVSGKGVSSAFHMSQMKGIFQSLSQFGLGPKSFLMKANSALMKCLDNKSFITTTYFVLNTHAKTIDFGRAGHCPALFYSSVNKQWRFHKSKGLGLGILPSERFQEFIQPQQLMYNSGDIIVMYTDGITEAKNLSNEEYGYDRLKKAVFETSDFSVKEIEKAIINDLYKFVGESKIDDDYTILIIKFC